MVNVQDLEKLKELIHLDPATLKFIAPLILNAIIPKVVHVGGKYISTAGLVDKIVADGHIGLEDLPILVEAWFSGVEAPAPVVTTPPVLLPTSPALPSTGTPWHPPTGSGPAATAPAAISLVAGLGIEFELQDTLANGRGPISYILTETPEAYEITLVNYGTTNFPITAGAYLHAVYLDAQGVKINFEDRHTPELYNTAKWTAKAIDGSGESFIGPGAAAGGTADIANFRAEEYTRTGGMDVPVHFPPGANEKVIDITVSVGGISAKPIRFPKVS